MSNDVGYNGWANYPTWAVKLWMDNDEGMRDYWNAQARNVHDIDHDYYTESRKSQLAGKLKEEFTNDESVSLLDEASLYADLLTYALGQVDWYEIAEALLEDNPEETEEETDNGEID